MGDLWALATIVGPILLAVAIAWALLRNRKRHEPEELARTESATHRLYEQEDAADHARDERVER